MLCVLFQNVKNTCWLPMTIWFTSQFIYLLIEFYNIFSTKKFKAWLFLLPHEILKLMTENTVFKKVLTNNDTDKGKLTLAKSNHPQYLWSQEGDWWMVW